MSHNLVKKGPEIPFWHLGRRQGEGDVLCCFSNRQICKLQPDFVTETHHVVIHRTLLLFETHTVQFEKNLEKLWICKTVSAVRQTNIHRFTYSLGLLSHHL